MTRSNRAQAVALLMSAQLFLLPVVQAQDAPPPAAPPPAAPAAPPPAAPAAPTYSAAQLDDLVSPIALYPDSLVAQILMASTYPLEVVQADRWRQGHKDLKGDALAKALEQQQWDPSVEALTYFPDLLTRMSKNLDWTQELGNAFLAQQADVMDAMQRMRKAAYDAGALKSSEQQKVTVQPSTSAPQQQIITVQPADPQVVYVPQYPPTAYGTSYAPSPYSTGMYPPPSAYPPGYNATTNLLSFGVGIALGGLIWGGDNDCDWNGHAVYGGGYGGGRNVNVSTGDITVNKGNRQAWQHNPAHRGGVGYKDPGTRQRYASAGQPRVDTQQARGFDRAPDERRASTGPARGSQPARETRPEARPAPAKRPAEAQRPAPKRAAQQPAARPAQAAKRDQVFGGTQQGGFERQASARGAASRGQAPSAYAGGGGRPAGGGGGRPSGGGGGRPSGGGGGGGGRGGRGR